MEHLSNLESNNFVQKTLGASHILIKILECSAEQHRQKLFTVGTRSRQGDLRGFLNLRLVSKQFNEAACIVVRKEFKRIQIDIDEHYVRCNEFAIGKHRKPASYRERNLENGEMNGDALEEDSNSEEDEEMPAPEDLPSEDSVDVRFVEKFLKWLADTFDPIVENFKIFDSWSFKPCLLPPSWTNRLTVFNSMHPDMDYCNCEQCIQISRNCRESFGPMSFKMAEDSMKNQDISYKSMSFTDAFLADIALSYTENIEGRARFKRNKFIEDFGGIRIDDVNFAVQTLAAYLHETPKPQPLEVIQLVLKVWEVKTVEFEVVKFMENDYYLQRCEWEKSGAFTCAHFASYYFDHFDEFYHVIPYKLAGTLDRDLRHEIFPIFDLRIDPSDGPLRIGSNLSILSLASQRNGSGSFSWLHQGRIAFNMFRSNRFMFITSGIVEFRGMIGTANWLKFTVREMMRSTWGPRSSSVLETGKTVYWINFIEDVGDCIMKVWTEHAKELFDANFPSYVIRFDSAEAFEQCDIRRVSMYDDSKRPDVLKKPINIFYCSFYDEVRNNTTHMKFIQISS